MAKKSRRARARHRAVVAKVVPDRRRQQTGQVSANVQAPTRMSPKSTDFARHYQHVIPEVKRIGLIAGAIIVVLIVLSFILG
jgi:hypothetical protein